MKRPILGMALCGGTSRRLGEDKASLRLRGEMTQLEYTLGLLGGVCQRVAAGVGPADRPERALPEGVESIRDATEIDGPMGGVLAGMRAAGDWPLLVLAVDMPLLDASHALQLVYRRDPDKLATCFVSADGQPEPLAALYEPACLPLLRERARAGQGSLRRFLSEVDTERLTLDRPELLASVNDAASVEQARRALSSQPEA